MKNIVCIDPKIKIRGKDFKEILDEPVIIRVTDFDEEEAEIFSKKMNDAHNTGQPIIPIVIDSYGGIAHSLLSMISDIQNSKLPVATIVIGKAMSCGAILLSCGTEGYRFADPQSVIMIHDVSNWFGGKHEEIKASAREIDRLQHQVFNLMARNCGHPKDYFSKILHDKSHAEWYLTPKEAKKHNLINEIRVPEFNTKISVEITLS